MELRFLILPERESVLGRVRAVIAWRSGTCSFVYWFVERYLVAHVFDEYFIRINY